jgi:hypothetical protein
MTVGEQFADGGHEQESCFTCDYIEEDDGSTNGNKNCPDTPTDDMIQSCPVYASSACYTGSASHNTGANNGLREEVYKGCSSFHTGGQTEFHNATLSEGIEYALAKQTCRDRANCNVGTMLRLTTKSFLDLKKS